MPMRMVRIRELGECIEDMSRYLDVRNSSSSVTENEKILLQTTEETETAVKLNESIYEVSREEIDMI